MLNIPTKNWWETDSYTVDEVIPVQIQDPKYWGPQGPALVKVFGNGSTQPGWGRPGKNGEPGFMFNYTETFFAEARALYGYNKGEHPVALVTRSARIMCVDIDGKNGGLDHVTKLGALPLTLAEKSKSGNGYHLFYETDEEWDEEEGFALIPDALGIVQGVDIRGTGCVYHHSSQRWNTRPIAPLPEWLRDRLLEKKKRREASQALLSKISTLDPMEALMLQDELKDELAKPIKAGTRNSTLFAIGSKLAAANTPGWQDLIRARAIQLKLSETEAEKIIENIGSYGDK